jgi:hypothetical protein
MDDKFNIEKNNIMGQTNKLLFDLVEQIKELNESIKLLQKPVETQVKKPMKKR